MNALCQLGLIWCDTAEEFFATASLCGFSMGPLITLNSSILMNLVGLDLFTSGYGVAETIVGFSITFGPRLASLLYHNMGNDVRIIFAAAAILLLLGSLMTILSYCLSPPIHSHLVRWTERCM